MVLCGHGCWDRACRCQEGEAKETRRDETCCVAGDDTVIPYSVISTNPTVTPGPPYCADSPTAGPLLTQPARPPETSVHPQLSRRRVIKQHATEIIPIVARHPVVGLPYYQVPSQSSPKQRFEAVNHPLRRLETASDVSTR